MHIDTASVDLLRHGWDRRRGLLLDECPELLDSRLVPESASHRTPLIPELACDPLHLRARSEPDGRVRTAKRSLRPEARQDDNGP